LLSGLYFATIAIFPKCFGFEETYEIEKDKGRLDEKEFQTWQKEEVRILSPYGYTLFGYYFPIQGSKRSVILSHGITYTLFGSVKYMKIFRDLGFNILIYDLRNHGKSGGRNSTFGFYERYDLQTITTWLINKVGSEAVIGTHGESMGAGITLMHAAIDPRLSFIIEDCSYSNLNDLFRYRLQHDYHMPAFPIIAIASLMSRFLTGMSFNAVRPDQEVQKINAPVLFIHGAEDVYIPTSQVYDLYNNKTNGTRKLYVAPAAAHAESFWKNQAEYTRVVVDFLLENKII
jgi:fermentation-respiration switch protein FrsA (DUF1100 family)